MDFETLRKYAKHKLINPPAPMFSKCYQYSENKLKPLICRISGWIN